MGYRQILAFENRSRVIAPTLIESRDLDDAGYADSQALSEKLPNAQLLVFEEGYGHLAPLVKSHEMFLAIDRLLAELSQR